MSLFSKSFIFAINSHKRNWHFQAEEHFQKVPLSVKENSILVWMEG